MRPTQSQPQPTTTMTDARDSEAISAYLSDLQTQVRAPSPPLSTVIRVLAEPLSFLGFLQAPSTNATLDSVLPYWSGPIEPTTARRMYFIQHLLPNHLQFILDNITVDWLSALPSAEQTVLFDTYFIPALATRTSSPADRSNSRDVSAATAMALVALQTLVGRVNQRFSENHSFLNKTILKLLKRLLEEYSLLDYFKACYRIGSTAGPGYSQQPPAAIAVAQATWDSFLSKLFSIPTRVSNAFGASRQFSGNSNDRTDLEGCFQEDYFFEQQAAQLQECVSRMADLEAEEREQHAKAFGVVIAKLLRLGFGREYSRVCSSALVQSPQSQCTKRCLTLILFLVLETIGTLIKSVVSTLWDKDAPTDTLGWKLALTASTSTTAQTFLTALAEYLNGNQLDSSRLYSSAEKSTESSRQEVHKAAHLLFLLGYGAGPGAGEESSDMIEEILFQGRVYGSGVLRALVCIQSGWPTGVKSSKGKRQSIVLLLVVSSNTDLSA